MFDLQKDIGKALKKYPSLQIDVVNRIPYVKGVFTAHNKANRIEIESYEVRITFPATYPYSFPSVVETSRKIPREVARHVKNDGSLCFGNPQDELSVCKSGITFTWFLDEILNTHLCREYAREKTKEYPTGERSHGIEGIWEGYYDILHTTDKASILKELDVVLNHVPIGRNTPCYCSSGKKYKVCHERIESEILTIGKNEAVKLFKLLKKEFEESK